MNRKIKNTLVLVALLVFILTAGGIYLFVIQSGDLKDKDEKLKALSVNNYDTEQLRLQVKELEVKAASLDSVLAQRKFNIPEHLSSIKFYDFITNISEQFSPDTKLDIEFVTEGQDREFSYFEYKVSGGGEFRDVYKLIYAIEESKELKKIKNTQLNNLVTTNIDGVPLFHVSFTLVVHVYFAANNRFATASFVENELNPGPVYDLFYPLIRNEIPPNLDELLDVQNAKLLALIPEGAFLADSKGTYLLWEGEPVYLGYLTKIDYQNNRVSFILNKGGIIEKIDLSLDNEENNKENKKSNK